MDTHFDTRMMARALQLARRGRYWAAPNPHVGCVLTRDGAVIGEGFTQPAGGNHAEVEALAASGDASGATAYVTLEPCNHWGRTGPCALALIEAGVKRVVAAMEDPNPLVSGAGLARLRAAGVVVECGLLRAEAEAGIAGFAARMRRGRGRVRAKLAMSLDGRTAMASGESQWITGPAARRDVQRLRAASGVIVTGVGTVLADDCSLLVRPDELGLEGADRQRATRRQPDRVILDSRLRTPASARVLAGEARALLFHSTASATEPWVESRRDLAGAGAGAACDGSRSEPELVALPDGAEGLDLAALFEELAARQYNEILLESGPRLAGAMLRGGWIDEIVLYVAPTLMGSAARPLFELPLQHMADQVRLECIDQRQLGRDWRYTLVPSAEQP